METSRLLTSWRRRPGPQRACPIVIGHEGGQWDEAFGYDLAWQHTFLLYSAEHGNLDNRLHEIGEGETDQIETRICQSKDRGADVTARARPLKWPRQES
jgi:hypothetical protein